MQPADRPAGENDVTDWVRGTTNRLMAVFALRRLRAIVERNAAEEAAVRRFSIRALLWFAVVVFSMPLLGFAAGAMRVYFEYSALGRPASEFAGRFYSELGFLALWLIPWTLAAAALVLHYRAARRAIPGGKGTPHGSNAFADQGQT
jgi:hypothetical protein